MALLFEGLKIDSIHSVILYNTNKKKWSTKNRKNHIIGLKLNGAAFHELGYQNFVISRNCIFFLNQRDDYDVQVYESGASLSIHFTTEKPIENDSFCIALENAGEIASLLHKAEFAKRTDDELTLYSHFYALCAEFERILEKTYFRKDMRMIDAKRYMDEHFTEANCLEQVVLQSGISARRFGELFRKSFDATPNRYIGTRKIERACELLESEELTVEQVAELCGFSDVYYFSKTFKKEMGVSPSRWK